jgi:hypothetical protein
MTHGTRRLIAVGLPLLLIAGSAGLGFYQYKMHTDPLWIHAERLERLRQSFRDPDSVKWGPVRVGKHDILCGFVNAKNGMGGYTGMEAFYALPDAYSITPVDVSAFLIPDNESTRDERDRHNTWSTWNDNCNT